MPPKTGVSNRLISHHLNEGLKMRPINIYTFVHDTVLQKNDRHLKYLFFDIFTPQLSKMTGRSVNVVFLRNIPDITNFDYLSFSDNRLDIEPVIEALSTAIKAVFAAYMAEHRRAGKPADLYLILIDGLLMPSLGVEGLAIPEANIAIATTLGRTVVAHEIGHCLGATHEDVALYREPERNDPSHCATFMATGREEGACSIFSFSSENYANIKQHLKKAP